jgi:hypothetical protein
MSTQQFPRLFLPLAFFYCDGLSSTVTELDYQPQDSTFTAGTKADIRPPTLNTETSLPNGNFAMASRCTNDIATRVSGSKMSNSETRLTSC